MQLKFIKIARVINSIFLYPLIAQVSPDTHEIVVDVSTPPQISHSITMRALQMAKIWE